MICLALQKVRGIVAEYLSWVNFNANAQAANPLTNGMSGTAVIERLQVPVIRILKLLDGCVDSGHPPTI